MTMKLPTAVVLSGVAGLILGLLLGSYGLYMLHRYRVLNAELQLAINSNNDAGLIWPLQTDLHLLQKIDNPASLRHAVLRRTGENVINAACSSITYTPSQLLRLRFVLANVARALPSDNAWWQQNYAKDVEPVFAAGAGLAASPAQRNFPVCTAQFVQPSTGKSSVAEKAARSDK